MPLSAIMCLLRSSNDIVSGRSCEAEPHALEPSLARGLGAQRAQPTDGMRCGWCGMRSNPKGYDEIWRNMKINRKMCWISWVELDRTSIELDRTAIVDILLVVPSPWRTSPLKGTWARNPHSPNHWVIWKTVVGNMTMTTIQWGSST